MPGLDLPISVPVVVVVVFLGEFHVCLAWGCLPTQGRGLSLIAHFPPLVCVTREGGCEGSKDKPHLSGVLRVRHTGTQEGKQLLTPE